MTQMAKFHKGQPFFVDYTPGSDVAAGDVVVDGDMLLICTGGIKMNGGGTGISSGKSGAMVCRGGIFLVAADGVIGKRKRVFWDALNSKVTLTRGANLQFGFVCDAASTGDTDIIAVEFSPGRSDTLTSTVAAAGSVQGDAAALSDGFNLVSGADATKGVLLPPASAGRAVIVKNNANAVLKVWPNTGDGVNAIAVNSTMSIAAFTCVTYIGYDATTYYSTPLLPS